MRKHLDHIAFCATSFQIGLKIQDAIDPERGKDESLVQMILFFALKMSIVQQTVMALMG